MLPFRNGSIIIIVNSYVSVRNVVSKDYDMNVDTRNPLVFLEAVVDLFFTAL